MKLRWVVPVFVVLPLVELALLTWLATLTSIWVSIGLVVGTGVLGGVLAKREALRVLETWRRALTTGEPPTVGLVESLLVLIGAVLLITPGVLTDLTGMLLMVPPIRRLVAARLKRAFLAGLEQGKLGPFSVLDLGTLAGGAGFHDGWSAASDVGRRAAPHAAVVDTGGEDLDERDERPRLPR